MHCLTCFTGDHQKETLDKSSYPPPVCQQYTMLLAQQSEHNQSAIQTVSWQLRSCTLAQTWEQGQPFWIAQFEHKPLGMAKRKQREGKGGSLSQSEHQCHQSPKPQSRRINLEPPQSLHRPRTQGYSYKPLSAQQFYFNY